MHRPVKLSFILLTCVLCCLLQFRTQHVYAAKEMTPAQWQQLTSDKAFGYKNDTEKVQKPPDYKPGAFEKAIKAFFEFWQSKEGNIILWVLVIGLVTYLVYRVFFKKDSVLFGKNNKALGGSGDLQGDEHDLATTNWEALRHQAVENGDLRLAVRYSYMWMLQLMQQRNLIQYRIDKTNYEYYAELNNSNYKQPFRQLSRQYEYAWYGRFELSQAAYNDYRELFDTVRRQMGA